MIGIRGTGIEVEMLVEPLCVVVLGVDDDGSDAGDIGSLQRPSERIVQQERASPSPLAARSTANRASNITGTGWRANPLVTRGGASAWAAAPTARL